VQMDVFCSDLSLRSAPVNLPHGVQMLDLSRNQVQNLTQETLAYHTGFHHLNLQANKIHFIQPGLFKNMTDLKVLDLSRNHLNVFALSKINIGPLTVVESLDLSNNGLYTGMSDYFLAESPVLANLSLNSNSITKIAQNTFNGSRNLTKISLHNNVIMEIEDGAFDSLKHLTELDLSKNSITCITDFNLYSLTVLNLNMDKHSLCGLEHSLVDLLLRENNISSLNTALSSLSLKNIDLSTNRLNTLPVLNKESSIESLNLQNNNLVTLEYSTMLALKHSLKTLYMGSNPLSCCSNLDFLNMVQHSALVVPDIEIATCIHDEYSEPVNIEKVTREMCHRAGVQNYIVVPILIVILAMIVLGLLVKCCHLRRRKHNRSFTA
ncbi:Leucine-rich repeat-containing protein 32, partial [Nibea albiflora]